MWGCGGGGGDVGVGIVVWRVRGEQHPVENG